MDSYLLRVTMILMVWLATALTASAQTAVEYIHTDALGTPVAVTNSAGAVIERSVYEPYGQLINRPLTDGPGFTGHVQDAATGLTYMQQRYYDPQVGMFLSVDPVAAYGDPINLFSRYRYANDNPYKFIDPDGRIVRHTSGPERDIDPVKRKHCELTCLGDKGDSGDKPLKEKINSDQLDAMGSYFAGVSITAPKEQGRFVKGDLGVSKWRGATLSGLRSARQLDRFGKAVGALSLVLNGSDFVEAWEGDDAMKMVDSGVATAFSGLGMTGFGTPGAPIYSSGSKIMRETKAGQATTTGIVDAHEFMVETTSRTFCIVSGADC